MLKMKIWVVTWIRSAYTVDLFGLHGWVDEDRESELLSSVVDSCSDRIKRGFVMIGCQRCYLDESFQDANQRNAEGILHIFTRHSVIIPAKDVYSVSLHTYKPAEHGSITEWARSGWSPIDTMPHISANSDIKTGEA